MFVVAIPVCNERERIVDCLRALGEQIDVPHADLGILLFLNNCTDGTRDLVETWMPTSPYAARVIEVESASASAGWARREVMNAAAGWMEEAPGRFNMLLTTDADSRVPTDWVALNRAALAGGADAVAGRIAFDPAEVARLPPALRCRQEAEIEYELLLAEIESRLDPRRGNPWPSHWTKSGASIAVSLETYRRVGGIPPVSSGEDHAFLDLVSACGLVVRQAPDIVVTTSCRLDGRARGGTADALKERSVDVESPCDPRLEPCASFVLRLLWRRHARRNVRTVEARRHAQRLLRPRGLLREIRRARLLLSLLRWLEGRRGGIRSSGSHLSRRPRKRLSMP